MEINKVFNVEGAAVSDEAVFTGEVKYKHCYYKNFQFFNPSKDLLPKVYDDIKNYIKKNFDKYKTILHKKYGATFFDMVFQLNDQECIKINADKTEIYCVVWSNKSIESCENILESLEEIINLIKDDSIEDSKVPIRIWHVTAQGPESNNKAIDCDDWGLVSNNYPCVYEDLKYLYNLEKPDEIGKLIFWYGKPGTGKTYGIRTLIKNWQDKFTIEVISEPEKFLNNIAFFYQILMASDHTRVKKWSNSTGDYVYSTKEEKGKLIILEDTPDLVLQESRSSNSHLMGRLLNLTDGIIGQGIKVVFLLTTNEEIEKIDPAFTRPGRALQVLEFPYFDKHKANKWLKQKNLNERVDEEMSLADLYAKFHDHKKPQKNDDNKRIGF